MPVPPDPNLNIPSHSGELPGNNAEKPLINREESPAILIGQAIERERQVSQVHGHHDHEHDHKPHVPSSIDKCKHDEKIEKK